MSLGVDPALTQTRCYCIWGTKPNPQNQRRTWRGPKLERKEGGMGGLGGFPRGSGSLPPLHKGLSSNGGILGPAVPH